MQHPSRNRLARPAAPVVVALACAVCAGWLPAQSAAVSSDIGLSPAERAWVQKHPVVTLALDDANPPLNFRRVDAQGESFAGASLDYANLVAKKAGLTLRLTGSTWIEALRKAMAHEVDGVMSARELPERRARLAFTQPYLEFPIAMAMGNSR